MLGSAVLAMIRGFTREVFAIVAWVSAAAAAYYFHGDVLPYIQPYIEDERLALGVTLAGIFFVTLIVVSLITMRISDFILDSRAGPLDRTLGFIFGAARGLVLVVIAVLFLNFFVPLERQPSWIAEAQSKPWLDSLGQELMSYLPEDPEAEIIRRLRGEDTDEAAPNEPVPDEPVPEESPPETTLGPGISLEDLNQLERTFNSLPPE